MQALGGRDHGRGPLVAQEPRDQVGAVTAEIEQSAAADGGVLQPRGKLRPGGAVRPAAVAVVHHDPADVADGVGIVEGRVGEMISGIPRRLVVHDDGDAPAFRGGGHSPRVRHVHGEGLLHHDGQMMVGAGFHHLKVVERVGEGGHGVHLRRGDEVFEPREQQGGIYFVLPGVALPQFRLRLHDADQLHVLARQGAGQEAAHVAMFQPDDREAQRWWAVRALGQAGKQSGQQGKNNERGSS